MRKHTVSPGDAPRKRGSSKRKPRKQVLKQGSMPNITIRNKVNVQTGLSKNENKGLWGFLGTLTRRIFCF